MDNPPPIPMGYELPPSEIPNIARPQWVYAVVGIYLLLLAALLTAPAWVNWLFDLNGFVQLSIGVSVLVISGLTLMVVPVRVIRASLIQM